ICGAESPKILPRAKTAHLPQFRQWLQIGRNVLHLALRLVQSGDSPRVFVRDFVAALHERDCPPARSFADQGRNRANLSDGRAALIPWNGIGLQSAPLTPHCYRGGVSDAVGFWKN